MRWVNCTFALNIAKSASLVLFFCSLLATLTIAPDSPQDKASSSHSAIAWIENQAERCDRVFLASEVDPRSDITVISQDVTNSCDRTAVLTIESTSCGCIGVFAGDLDKMSAGDSFPLGPGKTTDVSLITRLDTAAGVQHFSASLSVNGCSKSRSIEALEATLGVFADLFARPEVVVLTQGDTKTGSQSHAFDVVWLRRRSAPLSELQLIQISPGIVLTSIDRTEKCFCISKDLYAEVWRVEFALDDIETALASTSPGYIEWAIDRQVEGMVHSLRVPVHVVRDFNSTTQSGGK